MGQRREARLLAWLDNIPARGEHKPAREPGTPAQRPAGVSFPDRRDRSDSGRLRDTISSWVGAEVAPGRLMPWLPVAFGFGIVVYFTAEREPALWAHLGSGFCSDSRGFSGAPARHCLSACACACRYGAGACHRHAADRADRTPDPATSNFERTARRLCRDPRGARAQRPHRGPRPAFRGPGHNAPQRRSASASRCAREARRPSAVLSNSRRICRRRCSPCAPADTTSRATCISSASALPATRSAQSR